MEPSPGIEPSVEAPPRTDFASVWQEVVRDPRTFFATMSETGGLSDPMTFLAICAGLNAAGTLLVSWSLWTAVGSFIWLVLGSFVVAAGLTLVTQQIFDGRAGFEPIFRVVAYASAPAVAFWVPRLAALPCCYAWYLQVRGVERVDGFEGGRAALATTIAWVAAWLVARSLWGGPLGWFGTT
jgi:hypothetical protein